MYVSWILPHWKTGCLPEAAQVHSGTLADNYPQSGTPNDFVSRSLARSIALRDLIYRLNETLANVCPLDVPYRRIWRLAPGQIVAGWRVARVERLRYRVRLADHSLTERGFASGGKRRTRADTSRLRAAFQVTRSSFCEKCIFFRCL